MPTLREHLGSGKTGERFKYKFEEQTFVKLVQWSNFFLSYLRFQHSVFVQRLPFVGICIISNEWVLSV